MTHFQIKMVRLEVFLTYLIDILTWNQVRVSFNLDEINGRMTFDLPDKILDGFLISYVRFCDPTERKPVRLTPKINDKAQAKSLRFFLRPKKLHFQAENNDFLKTSFIKNKPVLIHTSHWSQLGKNVLGSTCKRSGYFSQRKYGFLQEFHAHRLS